MGKPKPLEGSRAVRVLLDDRQIHFEGAEDSEYTERVFRIESPLGLQGMGNISVAWDPARSGVTVHKLRILRGDEIIDVLAKQSFTTIRRETDLEDAMIDGVLTATLQPEGLQVGDIVEFAYTLTRSDPVMRGRSEWSTQVAGFGTPERTRIRASWGVDKRVTWKASKALGKPQTTTKGGVTEIALDLGELETLKAPAGAPARFQPRRELEFSEFQSWAEVSSLLAPLYAQASQLAPDSPLHAEVARIKRESSEPKIQAAAALRLVQDKVRYLALLMGDGGYTPAAADSTWTRRYGDCKAKSVLLIALLHELGIEAEPALVNAYGGEGLDERLPGLTAFNHVIVRTVIGGKVYWLDGTRSGDVGLDTIAMPAFRWALPMRTAGAALEPLVQTPLDAPAATMAFTIDLSDGILAPAKVRSEVIARGDAATYLKIIGDNLPDEQRKTMLGAVLKVVAPEAEVKSAEVKADPATGEVRVVAEGVGRIAWQSDSRGGLSFMVVGARLGSMRSFKREPESDEPFVVGFPQYTSFSLAMTLPKANGGFHLDCKDVDLVAAQEAMHRTCRRDGDRVRIEATRRTLAPEVSAAEARAAADKLSETFRQVVAVAAPASYRPTAADVKALLADEPKTADAYLRRGIGLNSAGRQKDAIADFDKAIELQPDMAFAYANRGIAYFHMRKFDLARADMDKAKSLDPRNYVAFHIDGQLALVEGRYADAAQAFGRAADMRQNNTFALMAQATAYGLMGKPEEALANYDAVLKATPEAVEPRLAKAELLRRQGQFDKAIVELDAATAANPSDDGLAIQIAAYYAAEGRPADAQKAVSRAIEIKPSAGAYLSRATYRTKSDTAARLGDIDQALRLNPTSVTATTMKAEALADAGRAAEGVALLDQALRTSPREQDFLEARAALRVKLGQTSLALKDYATARAMAKGDANRLNSLCWAQATANVALEAALADCEAALRILPKSAPILDSRAFVLLRLGRLSDAVEAYDAALKMAPNLGASLYGRGLAKQGLGQRDEGAADLAAARAVSKRVDEQFAGYGLTL